MLFISGDSMPSPFPGMNPYLENPALWTGIHTQLIVAIAHFLSPQLRPKYFVAVEERIYQTTETDSLLVGVPDVLVKRQASVANPEPANVAVAATTVPSRVTLPMPETVRERYLEVRDVATREVVTVIEILSPKNKRAGEGRQAYDKKRLRVFGSSTHLVEIDLLRNGEPMTVFGNNIASHYRILGAQGDRRPSGDLCPFNLQNPIPQFALPLRAEDTEPVIDLQALLNEIYDISGYDLVIDYSKEPVPPLSEADAAWNDAWLRQQGLR